MKSMENLLMENHVSRYLVENHYDEYEQCVKLASQFPNVLYEFIMSNIDQFLDESLEETYNNIFVFSRAATNQLMTELSSRLGSYLV